jgi:hypothetical protein
MGSKGWQDIDRSLKKERRTFPMFRIRRKGKANQNGQISPFTEMPKELKKERSSFGRRVRGFINFLLLFILGLALLGLVIAFAYQIIYNPKFLGEWASGLISAIQGFIQMLLPAAE